MNHIISPKNILFIIVGIVSLTYVILFRLGYVFRGEVTALIYDLTIAITTGVTVYLITVIPIQKYQASHKKKAVDKFLKRFIEKAEYNLNQIEKDVFKIKKGDAENLFTLDVANSGNLKRLKETFISFDDDDYNSFLLKMNSFKESEYPYLREILIILSPHDKIYETVSELYFHDVFTIRAKEAKVSEGGIGYFYASYLFEDYLKKYEVLRSFSKYKNPYRFIVY